MSESGKVKIALLGSNEIGELISKAVRTTQDGLKLIHDAAVQCLMHAEAHGDYTLLVRLIQEVKDNCPGVVVAGLRKWAEDHSPIRFRMDGDKVAAKMLKKDEKGYTPFNTETAQDVVGLASEAVRSRANRDIGPLSITELKGMFGQLERKIARAKSEDGRGFLGNTPEERAAMEAACEQFAAKVKYFSETVILVPQVQVNPKETSEGPVVEERKAA